MTVSIVTVEQYTTNPSVQLQSGDLLEVRGWYSRDFIAGDGVTPVFSSPTVGAEGSYYSITPTLSGGGYLIVPAHDIQATTLSNPTASYFEQLWVNGSPSILLMPNTQGATGWQIPTTYGTTIAFDEIATYNRAKRLVYPPNTYFTADETIAEIRRLAGDFMYAAVGVNGITSMATAPVLASLPIAVGDNDPRLGSYINVLTYGAVGNDSTDNTTAFTNAQTAAAVTGAALYIPVGTFRVVGGFAFTSPVAFAPGASIVKHAGGSLTFSKVVVADISQHFASTSSVVVTFSSDTHLIDIFPQWWGALLDNSTDDAAAINACITSVGTTSTMRGGPTIWLTGPACIGSTILLNRKALTFSALGWGRQGSTGQQPYLRWIGSAGSPMLRLQNAQGTNVRNLRLIGNASAKPSCAISLFQEVGFGISSNTLKNISIGNLADGTSISNGFTHGIAWEGTLQNNSEWGMENIVINGCSGYGIRQSSIQNVANMLNGIVVTNCTTGGIYVTGQVGGSNWEFGSNGTDIVLATVDDTPANASPKVGVTSLFSEGSSRMFDVQGEGTLDILEPQFQTGSFTASDGKIGKAEGAGSVVVTLKDPKFFSAGSEPTTPFISLTQAAYTGGRSVALILDGVLGMPAGGPQSNGVGALTKGTRDYYYIYYRPQSGVSSDFVPYPQSTNYLGGNFGGGDTYDANGRFDIPARLRTQPTASPVLLAAVGNAITVDRTLIALKNTSGGSLTLTSAPTIANGANGEIIRLLNVGAQNIVIQDQGTLANSNLRLTATAVTIAPRQSLELTYIASSSSGDYTLGDWVQTGALVTVI